MKKEHIILFLCTTVILTGCAGYEKQRSQDDQQMFTLEFNDIVQVNDGQNNESVSAEDRQNDTNSAALDGDNEENTVAAEPSEHSSQEPADNPQKNGTAMDLYAGFLKNEVPVNVASDYPQNDCFVYNLEPGKSYTFTTLGDYVNMRYLNPEHSEKTSYDYAQYVYLDSSDSSKKNLLVKFSGLGIYAPDDDSYAVYVITEDQGQLYLTDSYECWARSGTKACKNGLFSSDGSSGAGAHYTGIMALLGSGKLTDIYNAEILTGWWASSVSNETIFDEVFAGNEEIIFSVMVYIIGEKNLYMYDLSECTDDQISVCETYLNRCHDEMGIEWVTQETVEEAVKERCSLLGIDYNAMEQMEEAEWNEI